MFNQVAVVGANGLVGRELIQLIKERKLPLNTLSLFGRTQNGIIEELHKHRLQEMDLIFFAASSEAAKEYLPINKVTTIDLSSAFRMDPHVPLIIPEINGKLIDSNSLLSSPNCVATIAAILLHPIHQQFGLKQVILTALQSASGGGKVWLDKLQDDTFLETEQHPSSYNYRFNLFPHTSEMLSTGYAKEEQKIINELKKILEMPALPLSVTSIRVPVKRAHSISLHIELRNSCTALMLEELLMRSPGLKFFEDRKLNRFATPLDVEGKEDVYFGRVRKVPSFLNRFEIWAVGDQLLKGAALNAVQIAEALLQQKDAYETV